ncbi:MAG: hypothetical protein ABJA98_05355 [Acidobacteriota bacterium]
MVSAAPPSVQTPLQRREAESVPNMRDVVAERERPVTPCSEKVDGHF